MFGWGILTGWTNATSPQLRRNKTQTNFNQTETGFDGSELLYNESGLNQSESSESGFGGFGMDDEGSSWVGSSMAFGAILGSMLAGGDFRLKQKLFYLKFIDYSQTLSYFPL